MSMEHRCPIEDVAFSPNGDYVATASKDGSVKLWGFAPRNEVKDKDLPHEGEVESVAFSPDGELLTAGSWDGIILVWKVSTGELVKRLSHGISD
jgi:WD40 repeat protein